MPLTYFLIKGGGMKLTKQQLREGKLGRNDYLEAPKMPVRIVFDDIQSAANIGALIRIADSFALDKVYLCGEHNLSSKKLRKASKNLIKWVDIELFPNAEASIEDAISEGYTPVAIELCDDSVDYRHVSFQDKIVLVAGNERKGVSESALALCKNKVYIPMLGMGNSMNVTTATAIVISHVINQIVNF